MLVSRLHRVVRFALSCTAFAACSTPHQPSTGGPPRAEFLISTADSTFWVATTGGETRVRGVPLVLARYDGRYYELYTADDDRSYDDALLLGERVYRRDLLTGDSLLMFADTTVPRIAVAYAQAHPDERPLSPSDEGTANPSTQATAEVDILDVSGPYLSFEYHVDVDLPGRRPWHATRRGVLDLRSGKATRVADLFGEAAGKRATAMGRRAYEATRDSIIRSRGSLNDDDRRAADALGRLQFDERSWTLTDADDQPAVAFGVPGHGEGAAGNVVELDPLVVDPVDWWRALRGGVAKTDDAGDDVWTATGYRVRARYDTTGKIARLSLADSSKTEWPLASIAAPIHRIEWLDNPPATATDRKALTRAFNQAAAYDENTRVAFGARTAMLHLVSRFPHSRTRHASHQDRSREPARNIRAHDAGAREQSGSRVRRRRAVDDGQVRRYLGVSSQPQ